MGSRGPSKPNLVQAFSLSSLDPADAQHAPLLYRQREETFYSRTAQLRHGSYLRTFKRDESLSPLLPKEHVDAFLEEYVITGCAVVQGGSIRLEEYRHGNGPSSRNDIQSCTKSFTSTVLGIAHRDGKLSIHDRVDKYIPELKDTAWADVPLLALINMSSGVHEPMNAPQPDFAKDIYPSKNPDAVLNWLKTFQKIAKPWERFEYYNPNYYVLTTCISRALGEPFHEYLGKKIWWPAGMQYDGYIRHTGAGQVDGHGGLSVTLLDMARFGRSILNNMDGKGGPGVPEGWFKDISAANASIYVRPPGPLDEEVGGFNYQTGWWTPQRDGRTGILAELGAFAAVGIYGQSIHIIPGLDTVIVTQSGHHHHHPDLLVGNVDFVLEVARALQEEESTGRSLAPSV
ncbi:beta-lactamase/transpeptidase-like protein [Emericellopsis atlantica]|uniref:Beta-lactamase/transpeptidase-like protein n=1 Tax=Emericellopsis atlantica TaxID=2614577 RepID=A0A9P7ZLA1_9HYPO|nr:beta-lactamase/transpeptidase-like protein [Emericellopsis atlantica]KAG9254198.1 beta-lactamase/transpeptidase-like protein [Emericellopsis atlantica]